MRYATFRSGPWPRQSALGKLLLRVVPRANPDFDSLYEKVETWWFELDEGNAVCRELAFGADGRPIAAAPLGPNYGIFTDLESAPDGLGAELSASQFEECWRNFEQKWNAQRRGGAV